MSTTETSDSSAQLCWVTFGLPFRPVKGTYGIVIAPRPDVDLKGWEGVRSTADVARMRTEIEKKVCSVTACGIELDGKADGPFERFYEDQQGCVSWHWNREDGSIHATVGTQKPSQAAMKVALSMPEFWARLAMENEIWHSANVNFSMEATERETIWRLDPPPVKGYPKATAEDAQLAWSVLQKHLAPPQVRYLDPIYRAFLAQLAPPQQAK